MQRINSEAKAEPNSSDSSGSVMESNRDTAAVVSSSSSSSSSSEANNHDKDIAEQAPPTAGESAVHTAPGIALVAPTPPSTQDSTDESTNTASPAKPKKHQRPRLSSRRSSGTIIIPRDSEVVEVDAEVYDEGDARAMSPPRSTEEVNKMTEEARATLTEQAKTLQSNIGDLVDRVETVKSEHDKLETGNKFLQSYIGQLMHSTKITASGAGRSTKGKSRVG